jgi:Family of unknown function (DUF5995)
LRGRRALIAIFALLVCVPAARAYQAPAPPNIDWTKLLPPLHSPASVQPHDIPGCATPSIACIDQEIAQMQAMKQTLGCDHRAVFDTTYLVLTQTLRDKMAGDSHFFEDPNWVYYEDAQFGHMYFSTMAAYDAGQKVAPAWQIAFDAARHGQISAFQDMLLGINAHVQNDMPYMLAAVGLREPDGKTHRPDHAAVNEVLREAFTPVIRAVTKFDALMPIMAPSWTNIDDLTGLQLVMGWREMVWREAESLLNAGSKRQRQKVVDGITENSAAMARLIASFPFPGYRPVRDAYCRAHVL